MGRSWPLFVYFRHFLITTSITQIEKSIEGVLRIRTWGRIMVGADEITELRNLQQCNPWVKWQSIGLIRRGQRFEFRFSFKETENNENNKKAKRRQHWQNNCKDLINLKKEKGIFFLSVKKLINFVVNLQSRTLIKNFFPFQFILFKSSF